MPVLLLFDLQLNGPLEMLEFINKWINGAYVANNTQKIWSDLIWSDLIWSDIWSDI